MPQRRLDQILIGGHPADNGGPRHRIDLQNPGEVGHVQRGRPGSAVVPEPEQVGSGLRQPDASAGRDRRVGEPQPRGRRMPASRMRPHPLPLIGELSHPAPSGSSRTSVGCHRSRIDKNSLILPFSSSPSRCRPCVPGQHQTFPAQAVRGFAAMPLSPHTHRRMSRSTRPGTGSRSRFPDRLAATSPTNIVSIIELTCVTAHCSILLAITIRTSASDPERPMIHPPAEPPTEPGRRHGAGGCLPERDDPQTTPGHRPGAEADDWMPPRCEPPTDEELAGLCPDPFAGPPDGPDAWLADLSAPEVDAFLEAAAMAGTAARPASREAMAAGFTHRDPDPCAAGFAAGGPLDLLAPRSEEH